MIRFAAHSDEPAVRRLWETCFPDESGFNEYFFAHIFTTGRTLLSEDAGALCAMTQMLPYRLSCGGQTVNVTYIYGACTDLMYRRQGHMARLLDYSFALDRKAGRAASMLIPAEPWLFGFYEPFGYRPFFYVDKRHVVRTDMGETPRRLTVRDLPQAAALYERLAGPCAVVRDDGEWQRQLYLFDALGAGAYGWFRESELTAYAFCWKDGVQEALGLTMAQEQGLAAELGLREYDMITGSGETALGCIKWHIPALAECGYMNLMLN